MKITIDNLDGAGARDYSVTVSTDGPLKIERTLNAPSRCTGMLDLSATSLPAPLRRARVVVTADAGAVLFTGYLATEPAGIYAGVTTTGPVHRYVFSAISDEWLLDKQVLAGGGTGLAQTGGELLRRLTSRVDAGTFTTDAVADAGTVGVFAPAQTAPWSANAGEIANAAYASYRVLDGALSLQTVGSTTHVLHDGDGTLNVAALRTASVRELANDVTLSGDMEPAAYIAETFQGDGTTSVFDLAEAPYRPTRITRRAASSTASQIFLDSFNQGRINPQIWSATDPGQFLSITSAGLTMAGGNGLDGQTVLSALDLIEMGGTLVVEVGSVVLSSPSTGIVCGLYNGLVQRANCFAGYNARQSGGATLVVPLVNGVEVGTPFTALNGHKYTLRIRLHCPETERVRQTWYTMVDGVTEAFGGGSVEAPMSLLFELVDEGVASSTPAVVLYSGQVATSPARCSFAVVNSVELIGSLGYCRITQAGSVWMVSTFADGSQQVRMTGAAGEGVDCMVSPAGRITFFAGRIPVVGERFTVWYRGRRRSVARLNDAASVSAEQEGGIPGTARWTGKVLQPPARSTADCEAAAQAVLRFASSRSAAISGSYALVNPADDIWPGDALDLGSGNVSGADSLKVMVRKVTVDDGHARPELMQYQLEFANDWAEALGVKLSESVAVDALLPETASSAPGAVLANLQNLQLVSANGTELQVDAGTDPSPGGGFEVRRRDWNFGPFVDQDLVLRSPVRSFSIPRESQVERYYVRMYDGSNPPVYSRFSSAVFTDLPVSF